MVKAKLITPQIAKQWLLKNKANRPLRKGWVNFLAQQMKDGSWHADTGETIKFDKGGNLIDGQHRLTAIVQAEIPVTLEIKEQVDRKAMAVIDTGKSRTSSDLLSMAGFLSPSRLAATAKFILLFNLGRYSDATTGTVAGHRSMNVSNQDILKFVKQNSEELTIMINHAQTVYFKWRYIPVSILSGLYYVLSKKHKGKTEEFFEKLVVGANLSSQSSIYLLRERLTNNHTNKRKMPMREQVALIIIAWNYFRENKKIGNLVFSNKMSFPKPI